MKLSLVFNPKDKKLQSDSYSQTYRDMFLSLIRVFGDVQYITESCSANDIEGDVVIFYDVHSSHDIQIDGVKKFLSYSYMNDPHQKDFTGRYMDGAEIHKLGAKERMKRATQRGVDFVICPYKNGFEKYLKPHGKQKLVWFPVAPRQRIKPTRLKDREQEVLANGHLWEGIEGFRPYAFRGWAYKQDGVKHVPHCVYQSDTPNAKKYQEFIGSYIAGLALCDTYVVPKYLEIPLCGCVAIMQDVDELKELGFIDGVNCVMVNKDNFHYKVKQVKGNPNQIMADAGYKLDVSGSIKSSAAIVSSTLSVTSAAEISVLEVGSTGNIFPGESLYVQNNVRVNGTAQFVSNVEVLGDLTVAGYLSKSRTWNQSIAGSSSWSTGYTINAGEFYIVNVVYMETSNGAPQALSTWQLQRRCAGG